MGTESYALIDAGDILSWDEVTTDNGSESTTSTPMFKQPQKNLGSTKSFTEKFMSFTSANPTTYHVVKYFETILVQRGFVLIEENEPISPELAAQISEGGFFYTKRSDLTILPFIIGGRWALQNGAAIVGSHIDELSAKLKPISVLPKKSGYELLGVAPYSGGLSNLRIDRDLGIGGGVLVHQNGRIERKVVKSSWPVAKIPSLAPHFGKSPNYNTETEMVPIVGYETEPEEPLDVSHPLYERHTSKLVRFIADLADVKVEEILDLELELFDTQDPTIGGLNQEFLFLSRLDDRLCSWTAVMGLLELAKSFDNESIKSYDGLNMVILVDNEEIGSGTRTGARGKFLNATMNRIVSVKQPGSLLQLVFANSVILSADVTHLMNPNFKSAYLDKHYPLPNKGITVKLDANGHVVSDIVGYNLLREIASKNGLEIQKFQIRNDARSGGTIGPYLAMDTGSRVIDVGLPIMSMHSVRSVCGAEDIDLGVAFFHHFFADWKVQYEKYRGL